MFGDRVEDRDMVDVRRGCKPICCRCPAAIYGWFWVVVVYI
jgi:hypothetical protein